MFQINAGFIARQQERLRLAREELAVQKALVVVAQQKLDQSASLGIKYKDEMAIAKMDKGDQDGNNVRLPPEKQNPKRLCALEQTLAETTSQITEEEPKKQRLEPVS